MISLNLSSSEVFIYLLSCFAFSHISYYVIKNIIFSDQVDNQNAVGL